LTTPRVILKPRRYPLVAAALPSSPRGPFAPPTRAPPPSVPAATALRRSPSCCAGGVGGVCIGRARQVLEADVSPSHPPLFTGPSSNPPHRPAPPLLSPFCRRHSRHEHEGAQAEGSAAEGIHRTCPAAPGRDAAAYRDEDGPFRHREPEGKEPCAPHDSPCFNRL